MADSFTPDSEVESALHHVRLHARREEQRQADAIEAKYLRECLAANAAEADRIRERLAQIDPYSVPAECLLQIGDTLFRPVGTWMDGQAGKDLRVGGLGVAGPFGQDFAGGFVVRFRAQRRRSNQYVYTITGVEDDDANRTAYEAKIRAANAENIINSLRKRAKTSAPLRRALRKLGVKP